MKRLLVLALALGACSSNITPVATGEFAAPSGLAITSGGDRDLLFIANEGKDSLRALQLCLSPLDGGTGAAPDPCPQKESLQFVPAPVRVFPASIETGDRPRRLAGVRLSRLDGSKTGVVLAVGVDDQLRVVDARNLVEATNHTVLDGGTTSPRPVLAVQLDSPGVDVVAETALDAAGLEVGAPPGQTASAFVATVAQGAAKAELLLLKVGVDAQGAATAPVIAGQCTLDPVVPRKLAVVPGGGDRVYIADGAGDGVVWVAKASIPAPSATPAPCTVVRIAAGGRSARSLAVSPPWVEAVGGPAADAGTTATPHPAGELLVMVLDPKRSATAGSDLDPGGILIARTADKAIVPIPPSSVFDPGVQPMEPIATPGLPREVAFLRSNPADPSCPNASCTPVFVGSSTTTARTSRFNLLAAVTSTDGATYFVDVLKRRMVDTGYTPTASLTPSAPTPILLDRSNDPAGPSFTFLPATTGNPDGGTPTAHPVDGWFTAGVTHNASWRVVWHAPFPGLETRSGALSSSGTGTILLKLSALSLLPWVSDQALALGTGDTVSFISYTAPPGAPPTCEILIASESSPRFELSIVSLPASDTLELAPLQPTETVRPFDLSACPTGLQVVATVRATGTRPWLVYDGSIVRGRARAGKPFVANERRFDYPLDYAGPTPLVSDNVALAFQLGGLDPIQLANTNTWSFTVLSGLAPLSFRDSFNSPLPAGFASSVLGYSSPRYPQLVFTSVTGANAVVQADTTVLNSDAFYGIVSYK